MNSNSTLISLGQFDLKLNHLLIISILALSFSVSFLLRSQAADYGFELNEFDPFFNYRATQYIVDNGFDAYYEWDDDLSWYPHGRDVSSNSQVMLHITAAVLFWIFGGEDLYNFTIFFPVVFGSLTTVVVFALVRRIGGTTAGLFASLFFSVSIPIIIRGQIGWFKSEPLGLFFSLFAIYLFLSGINSKNKKIAIPKLLFGGIFVIFGISSWGGNQFFLLPLGIFFLTLPFLRQDHKFLIYAIPLFTSSVILTSFAFERLVNFASGLGGLSLIIPTIFLVLCIVIQNKSKEHSKTRNGLFLLIFFLVVGSSFLIFNDQLQYVGMPTFRYLNAMNPFLTTTDPLTDSVSEHATTTLAQSFLFHSVLMIFAGLGIWLIIKHFGKIDFITKDMISFSLIFGMVGAYVASTFVRLEVFASLSLIILSSLGLSILLKELFSRKIDFNHSKNYLLRYSFVGGVILLLVFPMTIPSVSVLSIADTAPTIINGGSKYQISNSDWLDTLEWIKNNTPKDAVIAAWWDYGYWIQTKGERASLADNSTLIGYIIEKIAKTFLADPDQGWEHLREMEADYFLVFVAGQRLAVDHEDQPLYILNGGGDESKKQWFMRIAGEPLQKFLHSDFTSGTDFFWNETLLGKMIPFSPLVYIHPDTNDQSPFYQPGYVPVYTKDVKFPEDGDHPLRLVYASPSFDVEKNGYVIGIFVYEVNKDYVPKN